MARPGGIPVQEFCPLGTLIQMWAAPRSLLIVFPLYRLSIGEAHCPRVGRRAVGIAAGSRHRPYGGSYYAGLCRCGGRHYGSTYVDESNSNESSYVLV